jgi:hypothetical protein
MTPMPTVTTPSVAVAPAAPVANPAAQSFVDNMVLSGVWLGNVKQILVKGQKYREGEVINNDLKLKVKAINPMEIILTDESGFQYHKRF